MLAGSGEGGDWRDADLGPSPRRSSLLSDASAGGGLRRSQSSIALGPAGAPGANYWRSAVQSELTRNAVEATGRRERLSSHLQTALSTLSSLGAPGAGPHRELAASGEPGQDAEEEPEREALPLRLVGSKCFRSLSMAAIIVSALVVALQMDWPQHKGLLTSVVY